MDLLRAIPRLTWRRAFCQIHKETNSSCSLAFLRLDLKTLASHTHTVAGPPMQERRGRGLRGSPCGCVRFAFKAPVGVSQTEKVTSLNQTLQSIYALELVSLTDNDNGVHTHAWEVLAKKLMYAQYIALLRVSLSRTLVRTCDAPVTGRAAGHVIS